MEDLLQESKEKMMMDIHEMTMSDDPFTAMTGRISKQLSPAMLQVVEEEANRSIPPLFTLAALATFFTDHLCIFARATMSKEEADVVIDELAYMIRKRIEARRAKEGNHAKA